MKSKFLQNINIHSDWKSFLTNEVKKSILKIEADISGSDFTPEPDKILRFLSVPLSSVKILIIGQDPYPQPGAATGRSFEVGTLRSWNETFNNISLKNILRSVYKAYSGEIIRYNQLKSKFDNEFPVLPPDKLFKHWESQGVLMLNTYFSCIVNKPGSHKDNWEEFSLNLFRFINSVNPDVTWFLWGAHAQKVTETIDIANPIKSMHPMMCFDKPERNMDFLYGDINCFELFKDRIDWTGFGFKNVFRRSSTLF